MAKNNYKIRCEDCKGLCCKIPKFREIYFPHELETMRGRIKTFEIHGNKIILRKRFFGLIHVLYVLTYAPCQHLDGGGLCKIYNRRPKDFPCVDAPCPLETKEEPLFWKLRKEMVKKVDGLKSGITSL